jgi:multidrug transporter EmrE-like cation transporter
MIPTVLWILAGAAATGLPALFVKEYLKNKNGNWLLACILCYMVLLMAYIALFSTESIHVVYPIIKVVSILLVVAGGLLFFRERIGGKGLAGLVCAVLAIYLLSADSS